MNEALSNPKIAIVLPVYNVAPYLKECLDSIIKQTYSNFTIFAIDDGSTDDSPNILDKYALKDKRIRVFHQDNKGLSAARNFALELIEKDLSYKFISFIDSDDTIFINFLEEHLKYINKTNSDVSICGFLKFSNKNNHYQQNSFLDEHILSKDEFINLIFSQKKWSNACGAGGMVWKQLYRADKICGLRFPDNLLVLEDEPFNVFVACHASRFIYFPKALYCYRQGQNTLCRNKNFPQQKINGRKLCLEYSSYLDEFSQLAIFSAYAEAAISLLKKELPAPDLRPYKIQLKRAVQCGLLRKKYFYFFLLFCYLPQCSKLYISLRKKFRKLRSSLGLRI